MGLRSIVAADKVEIIGHIQTTEWVNAGLIRVDKGSYHSPPEKVLNQRRAVVFIIHTVDSAVEYMLHGPDRSCHLITLDEKLAGILIHA